MILDNPADDMCTFKLMDYYITKHLPSWYKGFLFLRCAGEKALRERLTKSKGKDTTEAGWRPNIRGNVTGKIGVNFFCSLMRGLALKCGFESLEQFIVRAPKRTGTMKVAANTDKIGQATVMNMASHKSIDCHALYVNPGDEITACAREVMHFNPFIDDSKMECDDNKSATTPKKKSQDQQRG